MPRHMYDATQYILVIQFVPTTCFAYFPTIDILCPTRKKLRPPPFKQLLLFHSLNFWMRQNKWFENPLLNGIEKTDGAVFELIISGKLENFPSVQAVGKSRILLIIFFHSCYYFWLLCSILKHFEYFD